MNDRQQSNGPSQPGQYPPIQPAPGHQAPGRTSPGQMPPGPPPRSSGLRLGLGLALLALTLVPTLFAYILPTLRTLTMSFESGNFLSGTESVGGANFEHLFSDGDFFAGMLPVAVVALSTVVSGAVVASLVAWCLHLAGTGARMAARIVCGLAVVAFAPAALVVAWFLSTYDQGTFGDAGLLNWTGLISGVVFGSGVLVALAAFRGGDGPARPAATVVTAAGLTAFALTAAALQTFTFTYIVGFPTEPGMVPLYQVFFHGFTTGDFGYGAAEAVLLLAILAVLGIGAALLFILTRTRIEVTPGPGEPRAFRAGPGVPGILLLIAFAAGVVFNLLPWLTRMTGGPHGGSDATDIMVRTWGPPLITTGVALVAALAGAFAIGVLRPLGDGSRWLLLLFAPWLFVGSGPLVLANYEALVEADALSTFTALIPRAWIAVPALFVFTALFWGLEDRRRSATALGTPSAKANGAFAAAAWPLVALVGMVVWMVNANDTVWQAFTVDPDNPTAMIALFDSLNSFGVRDGGLGIGYPIVLLVVFAAAMVAAAVLYLPRVGVRVGRR
ncbi:hypothetical protein [Glycomyces arizonensis]|uniref:hypothetical protein n=1 Tax=Glycomyces arizonensis TaxID=256035 RepID=UPI000558ACE5|nr:hypothetical protein [Glycomyces arizonensis]